MMETSYYRQGSLINQWFGDNQLRGVNNEDFGRIQGNGCW
mgnify:CR=1 FL=1